MTGGAGLGFALLTMPPASSKAFDGESPFGIAAHAFVGCRVAPRLALLVEVAAASLAANCLGGSFLSKCDRATLTHLSVGMRYRLPDEHMYLRFGLGGARFRVTSLEHEAEKLSGVIASVGVGRANINAPQRPFTLELAMTATVYKRGSTAPAIILWADLAK